MAGRTIEAALRARANNFDAIRLFAASLVVFSHSFHVARGRNGFEPLAALTGGQTTFGHLAVLVFFVLSGFLIARSWLGQPSLFAFGVKRALRILPALAVVVAVSTFVVGPLFTALPLAEYFAAPATWSYLARLGLYTRDFELPGVFAGAPIAGVVNGALWTLKFEIVCYGAAALLGMSGRLRAPHVLVILLVLYQIDALAPEHDREGAAYSLYMLADLGRSFFAGVAAALLAPRIALDSRLAAFSFAALAGLSAVGLFDEAFPVFGAYLVLYLGFARLGRLSRFGARGDFSYGLYVWGFPAQQIAVSLTGSSFWFVNFALAFPAAFIFAGLSWRFVEAPALRLKPGRDRAILGRGPAYGAEIPH